MGIENDEGTHELYLASVFADGMTGSSYRFVDDEGQVAATRDRHGRMLPTDQWQWRPGREVIAFAVACDCSPADGRPSPPVTLATWQRVHHRADEDLDRGRLHVGPDEDAMDASERPEVEAQMRRHWSEHLAPGLTQDRLEQAWAASRQALGEVEEAVAAARRAGLSWVDIGRATGMTRQSARERWGTAPPA